MTDEILKCYCGIPINKLEANHCLICSVSCQYRIERPQTIEELTRDLTKVHKSKSEVRRLLGEFRESVRQEVLAEVEVRVGALRQALNEDRITDPDRMIDNDYINFWLRIKK